MIRSRHWSSARSSPYFPTVLFSAVFWAGNLAGEADPAVTLREAFAEEDVATR